MSRLRRERQELRRQEAAKQETKPFARQRLACWALLAVLAFAVFIPSLSFELLSSFDDGGQIVNNPILGRFSLGLLGRGGILANLYYYRPLHTLWVFAVRAIVGINSSGWHLSSILLHCLATVLVFEVLRKLIPSSVTASVAGAALFAVYPIHLEAVSWVSASNEPLYTIFILLAIISNTPWRTAAFFVAAALSKETAIACLPILILVAHRPARRATTAFLSFGVAVVFALRFVVLHTSDIRPNATWAQAFFTGPSIFFSEVTQLLFPFRVGANSSMAVMSHPSWLFALGVATAALLCLMARRSRLLAIGLCLTFLPLIPTLLITRTCAGCIEGQFGFDRYLYLPSVGVALIFSLLFDKMALAYSRRMMLFGASAILVFLLGVTLASEPGFRNNLTYSLFRFGRAPRCAVLRNVYGAELARRGEYQDAIGQFRVVVAAAPKNYDYRLNLGRALFLSGNYIEAEHVVGKVYDEINTDPATRESIDKPGTNGAMVAELLKQIEAARGTLRK